MATRPLLDTPSYNPQGYQPFSNAAAPPSLSGTTMQHPEESASAPQTASPNLRKRQRTDVANDGAPQAPVAGDAFIQDNDAAASGGDDDDEDEDKPKSDKKAGRRKIKIEFIQDKSRRHITFSKRKAGIMKKAYELSTLTGTQVLLLVVSETGLVYTFTTAKLQPLVTQPEGKNLIQACLNAPHGTLPSSMPVGTPIGRSNAGPIMSGPASTNNTCVLHCR
ncbi:SRF-TF-domain-containing protein [Heliocybe sulcata]|uniref:SRF-TF-domain-containing protein n=1 Tax=Heliocybe sulcata TaxID=5364 RepID=A0A5C3N6A5_9AGAM|nr:SRF-TF-domain-containing protein [Heliocybe sulcata]